jgi:hypothetical protein
VTRRPPTYGTAGTARGYVAAILAAAPAAPRGPVYVSVAPEATALARWPSLAEILAGMLPGVALAWWADVPAERAEALTGRAERAAYLAATHRAVVVVALRRETRRGLGPGVLAEAEAFAAQGRPVLVFTGRRLAAWPDCQTRAIPGRRNRLVAWLDVPPAPPAPLPTLAASLRALGVTAPEVIARASQGVSLDRPAAPGRDTREGAGGYRGVGSQVGRRVRSVTPGRDTRRDTGP